VLKRLKLFCSHRAFVPALLLLVGLLCLPALAGGFQMDDWYHQSVLSEDPGQAFNTLFRFAHPEENEALRSQGRIPWWAPMDLKVQLWRPVSVLTHLLDQSVAPGSPVWAHLHSILWLVGLAGLAVLLYRHIQGRTPVAALAALIYAVDEAHGLPVGWIANRNALIATALGICAVLAYARAADKDKVSLWSPLWLLAALLAGEAAVASCAWLLAHALFLDRGGAARRVVRLLPAALVVLGWRLTYTALGFGTHGSGLYLDPLSDPVAFVLALPERALVLLADQFFGLPSLGYSFLTGPERWAFLVLGAVLVVGWLLLSLPLLRADRRARFWAAGTLLSLLPIAATFPAARLLGFVGLGGAAWIALLIERWTWREETQTRWARPLVALHLVIAPLSLPLSAYAPRCLSETLVAPCSGALPANAQGKTVLYLNVNELCTGYAIPAAQQQGLPVPARTLMLVSGHYATEVMGVDAHTLELHIPEGLQSNPADRLFRSDRAMPVGTEVRAGPLTYTVLGHNADGRVARVRVHSKLPLADPELIWLVADNGTLGPWTPPSPNSQISIEPAL
jgi:hypothetical protein